MENVDLDAEFDPNDHDSKMSQVFGDSYYNTEDNEKPVFDEIDISDLTGECENPVIDDIGSSNVTGGWRDKYHVTENEIVKYDNEYEDGGDIVGNGDEGEDFIMDADYLPGGQFYNNESGAEVPGKSKKSKKSKKEAKKAKKSKKESTESISGM